MAPAIVVPTVPAAHVPRHTLLGHMSSSVVGNGVYSACQWGVLIAIAQLGSRAMLGQYALALAVTTPVFALMSLNARAVQASDATREYTFTAYLVLRLLTTAVALGVVLVAVSQWELTASGVAVILVVASAKAVDAVTDCYYGRLQQVEAMRDFACGLITNGVLTLAAGAVLLAATGDIVWLAVSSLVASVATLIVVRVRAAPIVDDPAVRAVGEPPLPRQVTALAVLMLPLGITAGLGAVVPNLPHYFVQHHLGTQQLGIYAALVSLAMVADLIGAAALQAVLPRLAREHRGDRREFARVVLRLSAGCAVAGAVMVGAAALCGDAILRVAYGPAYQGHLGVLLCLTSAVAVALTGAPLSAAATAARRLTDQIGVGVVGLVAGISAGAVLVPRFGLKGAAATMLVITATRLAGQLVVFHRCLRIQPAVSHRRGAAVLVSR
jgi:O-antigen/teichoic acid export membrane protein